MWPEQKLAHNIIGSGLQGDLYIYMNCMTIPLTPEVRKPVPFVFEYQHCLVVSLRILFLTLRYVWFSNLIFLGNLINNFSV